MTYNTVFCLKCQCRLPGQLDHGMPCRCKEPVRYIGKWDDMMQAHKRYKAKQEAKQCSS